MSRLARGFRRDVRGTGGLSVPDAPRKCQGSRSSFNFHLLIVAGIAVAQENRHFGTTEQPRAFKRAPEGLRSRVWLDSRTERTASLPLRPTLHQHLDDLRGHFLGGNGFVGPHSEQQALSVFFHCDPCAAYVGSGSLRIALHHFGTRHLVSRGGMIGQSKAENAA